MGKFLTPLKIEEIKRGGLFSKPIYRVLEPLVYNSDCIGLIFVDKCEETDLDSTPRVPFFYRLLGDRGKAPAVIHDHLYTTKCDYVGNPIRRSEADEVLRGATYEGLRIDNPATLSDNLINLGCLGVAWAIWLGVRIGGGSHWDPE